MFHKRLADKIKAGLAWSVISEDGERVPANDNVKDGESNNNDQFSPPLSIVSSEIEAWHTGEAEPEVSLAIDSPWSMSEMFDNSERKFQPEFLLKKPEKEEAVVSEPPVKRPTAAFRTVAGQKGEASIELPDELVQSGELLAESAISMSVSVLSTEQASENPAKRDQPSSDRERSIEFRSFVPKELKGAG